MEETKEKGKGYEYPIGKGWPEFLEAWERENGLEETITVADLVLLAGSYLPDIVKDGATLHGAAVALGAALSHRVGSGADGLIIMRVPTGPPRYFLRREGDE